MNTNLMKTLGSKQGLTGLLMFLVPCLSLVTLGGVGVFSVLFFFAAIFCFRDCRTALARHWTAVRWVGAAFLCHFLFALVLLALRPEGSASNLESPARMFLAVSALALVLAYRPDRRMLWWGVVGGAVAGALLVGYQRLVLDMERPGGLANAITTGDLLICLGLLSMVAAVDLRSRRAVLLPALGVLAGLAGAVFTGTRGGMLALLLAAPLFLRYGDAMGGRHIRTLVLGSFVLLGAAWLVPQTEVRDRVNQGVADVTTYFEGGSAYTNVGIRLELWKGAALLIAERPLMGVRHAVAKDKLAAHVKAGTLDPVVNEPVHFHNDILHVLVTGGVLGLLAWLSILVAPLVFFARMLRGARDGGKTPLALALAGMLVVLSYFAFGLTEVIFWSLRASLFYALMIFLLMGLCLNAKEADGK